MKNTTIAHFFKEAFNIDWKHMEINRPIDVSKFNHFIKSYNNTSKKEEYNKVIKIIRKPNVEGYRVLQGNNSFVCSPEHKISFKKHIKKSDFTYMEVKKLLKQSFYSMNSNQEWVITRVLKTNEETPILDFEVEKTHNYYSNNILSHNTVFGNPETQTGGRALKFYASQRIEIRKKDTIKKGEESLGIVSKVKVVKNKVAPPFKETLVTIRFGKGFDSIATSIDLAVENNIIKKAGSWYSYGEERIGQGKENVGKFLEDNPKIYNEIHEKIKDILFPKVENPRRKKVMVEEEKENKD